MTEEEFKPTPLKPGDPYLVETVERAFFRRDDGFFYPAKEKRRIEIRRKKEPKPEEKPEIIKL